MCSLDSHTCVTGEQKGAIGGREKTRGKVRGGQGGPNENSDIDVIELHALYAKNTS